jgi:hypothetical protein
MKINLAPHWLFAFGHAMHGLERLVRHFDFDQEVRHHTFVGVPTPEQIIEIIDGFLSEEITATLGGDRAHLLELRTVVTDRTAPAYEGGIAAAREDWYREPHTYCDTSTADLHRRAAQQAPADDIERNWYIEGYSRSWAREETNSVRADGEPHS